MTITEALKSLTAYPMPAASLVNIAEEAGIEPQATADAEARASKGFKKAKALLYFFLAEAPNVSQGGISYSFSEDERSRFKKRAEALLKEIGDDDPALGVNIGGYIGEDF